MRSSVTRYRHLDDASHLVLDLEMNYPHQQPTFLDIQDERQNPEGDTFMDDLPLCHYTADSLSAPPALTVPMLHDGGSMEAAAQKGRRMDSEEWSQWQSEFRGQIRALRHWLKTMEKRLPPPDPAFLTHVNSN
ncbi:hypothetical protein cypCar_00025999 [Cyprinus carpio]|nr:hypothetical protein cypCar_00025999 [Cyprinus carpio]